MRSLLGFLSLSAVAVLVAGGFMVGAPAICGSSSQPGSIAAGGFDYRALFAGLALGLLLANLARLSWTDLPHQALAWIRANEHNMHRLGWAALLLAVLFFY